jgi:hypothetical protein
VRLAIALGLCAACGRDEHSTGGGSEPAIMRTERLIGRPLVAVEAAFPDARFSINIPRGLHEDRLNDQLTKRWQAYDDGNPFVILVHDQTTPPATLAEFKLAESVPATDIVTEKTMSNGRFLVLVRRVKQANVIAYASSADHRLTCQAGYATKDATPLPDADAAVGYLAMICASLETK